MSFAAVDDMPYLSTHAPLKFPAFSSAPQASSADPEKDQARLRRHTRDLRDYLRANPDAQVSDLLDSGEQVGDALIFHYAHPRERRARRTRLEAVKNSVVPSSADSDKQGRE